MLEDAYRYLDCYRKTGLAGFWTKAIDRIKAKGINLDGWTASPENARKLQEFLLANHTLNLNPTRE